MHEPLLVAIAGPTGSGKSALALSIAEQLDGEIVNCDSVQIFKGFDVGTAKTPAAERRGIPHHLLDIAEPDAIFTAGQYAREARAVIAEVIERKRLPVVVGGTGFYLRALTDGLFDGPERDEELRVSLGAREMRRPGVLHRFLRRRDRGAAARIHTNDVQKLIRAVEVILLAGRPLSHLFEAGRDRLQGYRILRIGLDPPRAQLYERINERTRRMFECGLIEEVRRLLAAGVSPEAKPLESIGYSQALSFLRNELTLEAAIESTQIATRHYAKRQLTWFRREQDVFWVHDFGDNIECAALAISRIKQQA